MHNDVRDIRVTAEVTFTQADLALIYDRLKECVHSVPTETTSEITLEHAYDVLVKVIKLSQAGTAAWKAQARRKVQLRKLQATLHGGA